MNNNEQKPNTKKALIYSAIILVVCIATVFGLIFSTFNKPSKKVNGEYDAFQASNRGGDIQADINDKDETKLQIEGNEIEIETEAETETETEDQIQTLIDDIDIVIDNETSDDFINQDEQITFVPPTINNDGSLVGSFNSQQETDKAELQSTLDTYKKYINNSSKYTEDSFKGFKEVYDKALIVNQDATATQETIDKTLSSLYIAYGTLNVKRNENAIPPENTPAGETIIQNGVEIQSLGEADIIYSEEEMEKMMKEWQENLDKNK